MSRIGWVDFSSTERDKVCQVLAMLREKGTLDELGIGQIRDAFADLLFPGFSTIQTRAKYLITVPRIMRDYYELDTRLQKKIPLLSYLEQQENEVAAILVSRHGKSEGGIIGSTLVDMEKGVARRPSSVYWNGLRQFGVINTRSSLSEFIRQPVRSLDNHKNLLSEDDDSDLLSGRNLVHLDRYDPDWRDNLSIELNCSEAQFLTDKLTHQNSLKHSVISQLLIHGLASESLDDNYLSFDALTVWLSNQTQISPICRQNILIAQQFSEAITGAHIRYNVLIARKAGNASQMAEYEDKYSRWRDRVSETGLFRSGSADLWLETACNGRLMFKTLTQRFVRQWAEAVRLGVSSSELDQLVAHQASRNKGRRSLLYRNLGPEPNWQGMEDLSFRWPTVRLILADISRALPC